MNWLRINWSLGIKIEDRTQITQIQQIITKKNEHK